ncbi:MAG: hypothetical protein KBT00_00100 [Bacteroidales bacterium]|nr:hypothetical protein [Candidatus Cacconaster merdequi]
MKRLSVLLLFAFTLIFPQAILAQEQKEPDLDEVISNMVEKFTRTYELDYVQVFRLDSVLQENYPKMMDELEQARKYGAGIAESYQVVSDKWLDRTDKAIEEIFTPKQWERYMKSNYGKEKKNRDKRMAKREAATSKQ